MKGLNEFISEKEHFKGGKADNLSLEDIAKKHDVDVKELQKELDKGIEIELEHTDSKDKAEEIAKDHLIEFPDYYTRLIDMENDAEDEDDTIEITVDLDIPDDEDLEDYVDESDNYKDPISDKKFIKGLMSLLSKMGMESIELDGNDLSFHNPNHFDTGSIGKMKGSDKIEKFITKSGYDDDEFIIRSSVIIIPDEYIEESELNERRIRQTKKMKNSAKVVRETTEELFGKEGTSRPLADKIFKIFKRELRRKSKELGVPLGQVRQWKITLRDYDNPKEGTTVAGKRND